MALDGALVYGECVAVAHGGRVACGGGRHWQGELHHDRVQRSALSGKPGREQEFLDAHKKVEANWPGLQHANMIKTGERTYCIIAEWSDMDALANARTQMIATLDSSATRWRIWAEASASLIRLRGR